MVAQGNNSYNNKNNNNNNHNNNSEKNVTIKIQLHTKIICER